MTTPQFILTGGTSVSAGGHSAALTNNGTIASSTGTFVGQGTAGKTLTLANNAQTLTLTDVNSGGTNGCTSATAGTYVNNASTTTEASRMFSNCGACPSASAGQARVQTSTMFWAMLCTS